MPMWLAVGVFHEGWLRWHGGEHDVGAAQMHDGLRLMREQGLSVFMPLFGLLLAETEVEAGQPAAALATVDTVRAMMVQTGQCWSLAEVHRMRGELLLKSKPADIKAAEAAFIKSIEVARGQSAKRFELRAAMRLAQLWADQGKRAAQRGLLALVGEGSADAFDADEFV